MPKHTVLRQLLGKQHESVEKHSAHRERPRNTRLFGRRHIKPDSIKSAGSSFQCQLTSQTMKVTKQNCLFRGKTIKEREKVFK